MQPPAAQMSGGEDPAVVAVEAQLRAAVRRGEYRYAVTFLDEPERYADVPRKLVCCVQRATCHLLADECQRRPGEPLGAQRQRATKLVQVGALDFASRVVYNNTGACYAATFAACRLLTELTALPVISPTTMERCADMRMHSELHRVLVANADELDRENALNTNVLCSAYQAMMGVGGAPWAGRPHAQAEAVKPLLERHKSAVLRDAVTFELQNTVLLHVTQASSIIQKCELHSPLGTALSQLMRAAGCTYRWILAGSPRYLSTVLQLKISGTVARVAETMLAQPGNAELQKWGLTYVLLPLVYFNRLRDDRKCNIPSTFCRGRCCVDALAAIPPDMVAVLSSMAAVEIATAALKHGCCVRPAARLIAWVTMRCPQLQSQAHEQRTPAALRAAQQRTSQRRAPAPSAPAQSLGADADEEEDVGTDGERLSEWGDDDSRAHDEVLLKSASTQALLARALRVVEGKDAATATQRAAAAAAAADAAASALLAELESESKGARGGASAGAKSKGRKSKKKKGVKAKTPVAAAASEDSDNDGDDDGGGGGEDDIDIARLLSAQQGSQPAPKPAPVAPTPAPAVAAAPVPDAQPAPAPAPAPVVAAAPPPPRASPLPQAAPQLLTPRLRLGAIGCDCGDAACAQPQAHAATSSPRPSSAAAVEALFPWLSMAQEAVSAAAAPMDAPHEDDELCVICLDAPRDTPLAGCGAAHPAALCADCARRLLAPGGTQPAVCPLCRAPAVP